MDLRKKEIVRSRAAGQSYDSCGFTLLEITFALLILASSLIVLIGLQSSVTGRAVRDSNRLQAMMLSRMILAAIESSDTGIPVQDYEGTVAEVLDTNLALDPMDKENLDELEAFRARLLVEEWEPTADLVQQFGLQFASTGPVMKRVTLQVSWSDLPEDVFEVIYFVPID